MISNVCVYSSCKSLKCELPLYEHFCSWFGFIAFAGGKKHFVWVAHSHSHKFLHYDMVNQGLWRLLLLKFFYRSVEPWSVCLFYHTSLWSALDASCSLIREHVKSINRDTKKEVTCCIRISVFSLAPLWITQRPSVFLTVFCTWGACLKRGQPTFVFLTQQWLSSAHVFQSCLCTPFSLSHTHTLRHIHTLFYTLW